MNSNSGIGSIFGNNQTSTQQSELAFLPVRVIDIILDDKNPNFKDQGSWDSIGTIQFRPIYESFNENKDQFLFAKPLLSNIKHYPLKNEIVFILFLPDKSTLNTNKGSFYYLDTINIWSSVHHNALPDVDNPSNFSENQKRDYIETSNGAARRITDGSSEIDLGKTFKEKANIKPLLPFEGDVILESRWGSSIRFGSTVNDSNIKNLWSDIGENGSPILIIRNNPQNKTKEGWIPTLEDINLDGSSFYCGSEQAIPIKVASTNQKSFGSNINNTNPQNVVLNDVTPTLSSTDSTSTSDNSLSTQDNSQPSDPQSTPSVANTDSLSNNDDKDFLFPGDVVEKNAEKELEDTYFVPDDLDLTVPPGTQVDLIPSERIKPGGFIIPAAGKLTSKYEVRKDPFNANKTESHRGVDIANKIGTPVYASADGKIVRADLSPSYGNVIIIYHEAKNVYSLYAHLSAILKPAGSSVTQGDIIGRIGSTGKSTGPHLHFEIISDTKFGASDFYSKNYKKDPISYIT
jgi:murein DD-endopeptidase MepM/ murein hydrolase activator NlpD